MKYKTKEYLQLVEYEINRLKEFETLSTEGKLYLDNLYQLRLHLQNLLTLLS